MEDCILIADSGSTKTDWMLQSRAYGIFEYQTTGINPVRDGKDAIFRVLEEQLLPNFHTPAPPVTDIHFYGAGCLPPYTREMETCLAHFFPSANVEVTTDLMGAARALCQTGEGIVCILGTGSNSGYYDGRQIVRNVSPLGFILGDEGSGAVLGKILVGQLFKAGLPHRLKEAFVQECGLDLPDIIDHVYRRPQPNRFLASLVPFIQRHHTEEDLHRMLVEQFRLFLSRNVAQYGRPELPVNFVGSIAHIFREELCEALAQEGLQLGKIMQRPIGGLAEFHKAQTC